MLTEGEKKKNKKPHLSRNQKGEYSAESLKLVGNLGTDFRNCGHGPQEQAKERESERRKNQHPTLSWCRGKDETPRRDSQQCAVGPPEGFASGRTALSTASCSAQGWDREGLPNREEKTKAKVKSNAFGKGDGRWGRSWPLAIMTGLFRSAMTRSISTPFHSDSNRGDAVVPF